MDGVARSVQTLDGPAGSDRSAAWPEESPVATSIVFRARGGANKFYQLCDTNFGRLNLNKFFYEYLTALEHRPHSATTRRARRGAEEPAL